MFEMDETITAPITLAKFLTIILFIGGLISALFYYRYEQKKMPNRASLTATLTSRSWNTAHIAVLLGTLFFLYFLASCSGLLFYEEQIPTAQLVITLLIYGLLVMLIAAINRKRGGDWATSMGMGRKQLRAVVWAPPFYLAMMPPLLLLTKAWHVLLELIFRAEPELQEVARIISGDLSWLEISYILTAIFAAPVYEELIFRGIAFPYFAKRIGLKGSILLVSILFALIHFHLPSLIPLTLLSAVLCLAYWRTKSLWVSIGIHMLFNAVTILALNSTG